MYIVGRLRLRKKEMSPAEIETEGLLGNIVTAIASALRPGAMLRSAIAEFDFVARFRAPGIRPAVPIPAVAAMLVPVAACVPAVVEHAAAVAARLSPVCRPYPIFRAPGRAARIEEPPFRKTRRRYPYLKVSKL